MHRLKICGYLASYNERNEIVKSEPSCITAGNIGGGAIISSHPGISSM
jgi:hypothetical protein